MAEISNSSAFDEEITNHEVGFSHQDSELNSLSLLKDPVAYTMSTSARGTEPNLPGLSISSEEASSPTKYGERLLAGVIKTPPGMEPNWAFHPAQNRFSPSQYEWKQGSHGWQLHEKLPGRATKEINNPFGMPVIDKREKDGNTIIKLENGTEITYNKDGLPMKAVYCDRNGRPKATHEYAYRKVPETSDEARTRQVAQSPAELRDKLLREAKGLPPLPEPDHSKFALNWVSVTDHNTKTSNIWSSREEKTWLHNGKEQSDYEAFTVDQKTGALKMYATPVGDDRRINQYDPVTGEATLRCLPRFVPELKPSKNVQGTRLNS